MLINYVMSTHPYILYLRKSSESEERQELSIPAQRDVLVPLAQRKELTLVGEPIEESKSARKPGREKFTAMIEMLQRGEASGIVCWKLDRLARNPLDGGQLMWLLSEGTIKEIVTPERTYSDTSDDKLLMSIIFGMATKYVDDLSDNVRRGSRRALAEGRWPGKPKLGYVRDRKSHMLVADDARWDQLRELWQMVLEGVPPMDALRVAREEMKLHTNDWGSSGGALLTKSHWYRMLRDPFYAGLMTRGGETAPGNHPHLVSMVEFEAVQRLLDRNTRSTARPKGLFFPYRGLIRCGSCASIVTARNLTKKNGRKYVYYHCCRKERRYGFCPESAVQLEDIEEALVAFVDSITPPTHWLEAMLKRLDERRDRIQEAQAARREAAARERHQIEKRLERLRSVLLDGVISSEDYKKDSAKLMQDAERLRQEEAQGPGVAGDVEPLLRAAEVLSIAKKQLQSSEPSQRHELVRSLTCNLLLTERKLLIQAKKPYSLLAMWSPSRSLSAWLDCVETEWYDSRG